MESKHEAGNAVAVDIETMDPAARKDVIAKRISVLLNMLVKEGLRPSHQMQLNKELEEYMDMDDGGDYTLTEDEDDSDEDSSVAGDVHDDPVCENDQDCDILTTEDIHVNALANETTVNPIAEKEMEKIANFMCRCAKGNKENDTQTTSCIKKFDPCFVYDRRQQISLMTADMRDMLLFGHYDTHVRTTELTSSNKKIATKRKASWTQYIINDVTICKSAYMFMHW